MSIKIAQIGCGYWGINLFRVFSQVGQVSHLIELDSSLKEKVKKINPKAAFTDNWKEVVQSPEVDAVVIATPAGSHYQLAWEALNQGKHAGRNMAGASEAFTYMPYFFSDLFEFGYEAVGEVDARLETFADWQKENDTGVVYDLEGGQVRGAMLCNVWDKVDAARELIRKAERVTPEDLRGAIR